MSFPAIEARDVQTDAPAKARGPFVALKWQGFLAIFVQRLGLNQTIGGVLYPLPIALLIMPFVLAWLMVQGWAKPSPTRVLLYCALVVGGCCSLLFAKQEPSTLSLYMYLALYALFLFPVVLSDSAYERFYRIVVSLGAAICVVGVAQYVLQYVWSPNWLFSWRDILQPEYLIEYNTRNFITWGVPIYKANGFFLMEASWLSQLAARTLLLAIILLKDWRYGIPCGAAMLASYSGTGMMLFAIFGLIPTILLFMRDRRILPVALVGMVVFPVLLVVFSGQLGLERLFGRLAEFNNPNSSGYFRFVLSQQIFVNFLSEPPITMLFGSGPGVTDSYLAGYISDGFTPGWLKLIVDYGFFGFVTFCAFLLTCVYQTTRSPIIAGAILFQYLYLDGSLVVPQAALLTLFMACAVVRRSTFKPFGGAPPAEQRDWGQGRLRSAR